MIIIINESMNCDPLMLGAQKIQAKQQQQQFFFVFVFCYVSCLPHIYS